jgi:hypothetical protein
MPQRSGFRGCRYGWSRGDPILMGVTYYGRVTRYAPEVLQCAAPLAKSAALASRVGRLTFPFAPERRSRAGGTG